MTREQRPTHPTVQTSEGAPTSEGERAPHEPKLSLADRGSEESAPFGVPRPTKAEPQFWGDVEHECIWCGETEGEALLRRHVCGGCAVILGNSDGPVDFKARACTDYPRTREAHLEEALRKIAESEAGDEQAFDWAEFYDSIRRFARSAIEGEET